MKTLFKIGEKNTGASTVLCDWGKQHCCLAGYNVAKKQITWLTYRTFEKLDHELIDTIVQEMDGMDGALICSSFPEFLLAPVSYDATDVLPELYNYTKGDRILTDTVNEWQLRNYYWLPNAVLTAIDAKFSNVSYNHLFTPALKVYNGVVAADQIAVQFFPNHFSVLVKKEGHLELAQIYTYKTPLDVVYYLLKIIEALGLSIDETTIVISGLIEESSDLYKELHQYFLHLHFPTPSTVTLKDSNYPTHFFTSLYNLTACVS